MPLNLQNATVLSYTQNSRFFGEVFRFQNVKNLTVEGLVRDIGNVDGVSGIAAKIDELFTGDKDYDAIVVNGYNFGRGRIRSINFIEGNDVRLKSYSINVECNESGNLYNLTGIYFSGVGPSTGNRYDLIDTFNENFSYNRDGESYGYRHSVSLRLHSGFNVNLSPINLAKAFAQSLITGNVPFGFFTYTEDKNIGFKTYSESYNKITNECNFTENYSRPINNAGYLFTRTNAFELNQDGIAVISENANIKNISGNQDSKNFNKLDQLVDSIASGAYDRCNDIFSAYAIPGAYPLYSGYTTYSKNLNQFANIAEYNIVYTNDPKQISGCSWNYTTELAKESKYYTVKENGNIVGHGVPFNDGYFRAKAFYPVVKNGVYGRCYSTYSSNVTPVLALKRVAETQNSSQFNGTVQYSFEFSDNPINNEGNNGVKTQVISVNDRLPTQLINKFEIFNFGEIVQPQNNATLGNRSLSLEFSLTKDHSLSTVKNYARTKANEYIPAGNDVYVAGLNYSYSPVEKTFTLNAEWNFQRTASTTI